MMTRLIAGLALVLVATAGEANAQAIDEAWIVTRIVAGEFDELRRVRRSVVRSGVAEVRGRSRVPVPEARRDPVGVSRAGETVRRLV